MSTRSVIVGMSGGVDSSVSAYLLKQQGYNVSGLFMKNWDEDDGTEYCTAKQDLADAEQVCKTLGIPLHTANFAAEYWDNVFEHFLTEYRAGRTPNPDILCNREIKFNVFLRYAESLGAEAIATGHYAQLNHNRGKTDLIKGTDPNKDQSYFLHAVNEHALSKTLFPIGNYLKSDIRRIASEQHLITHNKKDSTGICFIGERRFKDFLQQYLPAQAGNIVDEHGHTIGQHEGLMYHTIGQRQGLGIGGLKNSKPEPWYVADKDIDSNTLVVVQGADHPALHHDYLLAENIHWIGQPPTLPYQCHAKIRYRQSDQACHIEKSENNKIKVIFETPQRAISPGQSVVFYDKNRCLGGGIIVSRGNHSHRSISA